MPFSIVGIVDMRSSVGAAQQPSPHTPPRPFLFKERFLTIWRRFSIIPPLSRHAAAHKPPARPIRTRTHRDVRSGGFCGARSSWRKTTTNARLPPAPNLSSVPPHQPAPRPRTSYPPLDTRLQIPPTAERHRTGLNGCALTGGGSIQSTAPSCLVQIQSWGCVVLSFPFRGWWVPCRLCRSSWAAEGVSLPPRVPVVVLRRGGPGGPSSWGVRLPSGV